MAINRITCCVDFSDRAEAAFDKALEMAGRFNAKLYVVHVLPPVINPLLADDEWPWPEEPKRSLILKVEERLHQEYGARIDNHIDADLVVLDGHVSSEIITFLEEQEVDLVIVGSYGASGMGLVLFGSVANRIAHKAPCSVMIVR
jgi:universal stress protein A